MTKKAFLYCRVSTAKQSEIGLESQKQAGTDFWEKHVKQDYPELVHFTDDGVSAAKHEFLNRPAGKELNIRAERGSAIIFPKLDRGFRDMRDALNCLHLWDQMGVRVYIADALMPGLPYYDSTNPMCKFGMMLAAWLAELEVDRVRKRNSDFRDMATRQGRASTPAPYGWKNVRKGAPQGAKNQPPAWIQPNPEEQEILEFVHTYKRKGFGFGAIAKHINAAGKRRRNGKEFTATYLVKYYGLFKKVKLAEKNFEAARKMKLRPWEFVSPNLVICTRFDVPNHEESADARSS
jgi:DNA invertase Pin-like site-specific DNA recombinase